MSQVNQILDGEHFDESAILNLATRRFYADAAWLLSRATRADRYRVVELIPALLEANERIAPNRFASVFGLGFYDVVPDVEDLKALRAPGAKCALAALGLIEWSTATREARAAYALRKLVFMFRERQQ